MRMESFGGGSPQENHQMGVPPPPDVISPVITPGPEISGEDIKTRERLKERREAADRVVLSGEALMLANNADMDYHTLDTHIKPLYVRAEELGNTFGLTEEQRKLTKMVISYHDTVINTNENPDAIARLGIVGMLPPPPKYNPDDPKTILAQVQRARGAREGDKPAGARGNEGESARLLVEEMKRQKGSDGKELFTDDEITTAKLAIEATYPDVDGGPDWKGAPFKEDKLYGKIIEQNPNVGKIIDELEEKGITKGVRFFQPHLDKLLEAGETVPEEVLIMAMGDLGGSGIAELKEFSGEGDAEFRELNINIKDNLDTLLNDAGKKEERRLVTEKMQAWLNDQISFVTWQMINFEKKILLLKQNGQLNDQKEAGLRANFSNYEANIRGAMDRANRIKDEIKDKDELEAFKIVSKEMGY